MGILSKGTLWALSGDVPTAFSPTSRASPTSISIPRQRSHFSSRAWTFQSTDPEGIAAISRWSRSAPPDRLYENCYSASRQGCQPDSCRDTRDHLRGAAIPSAIVRHFAPVVSRGCRRFAPQPPVNCCDPYRDQSFENIPGRFRTGPRTTTVSYQHLGPTGRTC